MTKLLINSSMSMCEGISNKSSKKKISENTQKLKVIKSNNSNKK